MSVLENFKNIPRSPYGGRQGSNIIFFLQICNEVSGEKKKGLSPANGRQAPVTHPSGDQPVGLAYRRQGGRSPLLRATGGPVAPHGRPGQAAYIRPPLIPSSHLTSKNRKKSRKKRGVRRREAAKFCRIPHL